MANPPRAPRFRINFNIGCIGLAVLVSLCLCSTLFVYSSATRPTAITTRTDATPVAAPVATPVIDVSIVTPVFIAPADALRVIAQDVCKNRFVDVRYENDIAIVRCRVETGARAEATYFALGNFGNIARATMSQTKASEVRMTFTHTTHDAYGNDSEHDAMTMTMPRALADKLKWDNIYNDDLLSLLIAGDSGAKIVVDSTWKQ